MGKNERTFNIRSCQLDEASKKTLYQNQTFKDNFKCGYKSQENFIKELPYPKILCLQLSALLKYDLEKLDSLQ